MTDQIKENKNELNNFEAIQITWHHRKKYSNGPTAK